MDAAIRLPSYFSCSSWPALTRFKFMSALLVLGGIFPQIARMGGVGALHLGYDLLKWQLLRDDKRVIPGPDQFVLYQTGAAPP